MLRIIPILSLVFAIRTSLSAHAAVELCADTDNALAERLAGTWTLDETLSRQIGANVTDRDLTALTFTKDAKQFDLFTTALNERPQYFGACVYLAGVVKGTVVVNKTRVERFSSPFVVTVANGNPILMFDERGYAGSGPIGDAHVSHVSLVNPETKNDGNDLLFVGGDHAHEGKIVFRREK